MNVDRARQVPNDARLPPEDLIHPAYDEPRPALCEEVVVVLSTQRSGSTMLCEMLRAVGHSTPHEYFQPYLYLPLLAERGGCVGPDRTIDWPAYARFLVARRTSSRGVLGINAHAKHLPYLTRALPHLPGRRRLVTLKRADLIGQALSLAEARATGRWTDHFAPSGGWALDCDAALSCLREIELQNAKIDAFVRLARWPTRTVTFEDLISDPENVIARASGLPQASLGALRARRPTRLERQSDTLKRGEEARRFASYLLEAQPFGVDPDDLDRL